MSCTVYGADVLRTSSRLKGDFIKGSVKDALSHLCSQKTSQWLLKEPGGLRHVWKPETIPGFLWTSVANMMRSSLEYSQVTLGRQRPSFNSFSWTAALKTLDCGFDTDAHSTGKLESPAALGMSRQRTNKSQKLKLYQKESQMESMLLLLQRYAAPKDVCMSAHIRQRCFMLKFTYEKGNFCQTEGLWATSGPPHHFMLRLRGWKTYGRLKIEACAAQKNKRKLQY